MKNGPFESYKFDHVKFRDTGSTLPVVFDIERGYRRCDCVRAKDGETVVLIGVSNIKADEPTKGYKTQESEEVYALLGIVLNSAKEAEVLGEFFKEIAEKMAERKDSDVD